MFQNASIPLLPAPSNVIPFALLLPLDFDDEYTSATERVRKQNDAALECAVDAVNVADLFSGAEKGRRAYHVDYALRNIRTLAMSTDLPLSTILKAILEGIENDDPDDDDEEGQAA